MTQEILLVDETELLIEAGDSETLLVPEPDLELLEVAEQGPPGAGLPAGGTAGQVLVKHSDSPSDAEWQDAPQSLPAGGTAGQILTKNSDDEGDATWQDPAPTGATPDDIANVMAFAADQG